MDIILPTNVNLFFSNLHLTMKIIEKIKNCKQTAVFMKTASLLLKEINLLYECNGEVESLVDSYVLLRQEIVNRLALEISMEFLDVTIYRYYDEPSPDGTCVSHFGERIWLFDNRDIKSGDLVLCSGCAGQLVPYEQDEKLLCLQCKAEQKVRP